jgi:hypothetical protein
VVYQHVAHRASVKGLASSLLEFFGLHVYVPELVRIKALMAQRYTVTYCRLLKALLAGAVLYIDETEVKLKNAKGYVWVLANMEVAVYLYRPTREGEFLSSLLRGFGGVLVSDFYAAYDSLPCPQQKCLLHLIRDMNQEMLSHPFDEELRQLTRAFGLLLQSIIETTEKQGLKRIYLKKHDRGITSFFKNLETAVFHSEAARDVQARLLRTRSKLFTFVEHDGVSWNNNCAEHAVKRFAYYREVVGASMKEPGLTDYLVLLSLYQTCRYKGVSFLKFLLSQERDIDLFCAGKRRKPELEVQVYPRGVSPPHWVRRNRGKNGAPLHVDDNAREVNQEIAEKSEPIFYKHG